VKKKKGTKNGVGRRRRRRRTLRQCNGKRRRSGVGERR